MFTNIDANNTHRTSHVDHYMYSREVDEGGETTRQRVKYMYMRRWDLCCSMPGSRCYARGLTPIIGIRLALNPANASISDTRNVRSPGTDQASRKTT